MSVWRARFSPDGRWIAVTANKDLPNRSTLYVTSVPDGNFVQVTDGSAFDTNSRWSSDGTTLYFLSTRGGGGKILNIWGIRFDPKRGRPLGKPFLLTDLTGPSRLIPGPIFGTFSVADDRLVVPIRETSGNIWMLENVR